MKLPGILWAMPITLPALLCAALFCTCRASLRYRDGAFDCAGASVARVLTWLPTNGQVSAITIGHVIFSRDDATAVKWCAHERIHTRQYERWGVFFPLAYVTASAIAWTRGQCPYRDNIFEREARQSA